MSSCSSAEALNKLIINANQVKCCFLRRGENQSTLRKTSWCRVENQQTQPTYEAKSGNWWEASALTTAPSLHPEQRTAQTNVRFVFLPSKGKVKSAIMLLDSGSKVNATDLVRDTPLHLALRANHAYDIAVQLTSVLLRYGASPTLLGRDDDMPLDVARQTYQGYCSELLDAALGEKTYLLASISGS